MNPFIPPELNIVLPIVLGATALVALVVFGMVLNKLFRSASGVVAIIGLTFLVALSTLMTLSLIDSSKIPANLDVWLQDSYGIEASDKVLDSLNPYGSKNDQNLEVVVNYKGEPTTVKLTPYEDGYILVNEAKDPLAQR